MIKQDVAEPAAEHDPAERSPGDEVAHLLNAQLRVAPLRKHAQQPKTAGERQDVSHPVPARSEISPKVKDERIKIVQVIGEHEPQSIAIMKSFLNRVAAKGANVCGRWAAQRAGHTLRKSAANVTSMTGLIE